MYYSIVTTGIIIGILISAPMGPLGILTIQRTLNKGRLNGVVTGLGAPTSDLIYAILVGFSMSFINKYIAPYGSEIKIIGSIVLFIFGYIIFRKKPQIALDETTIGTSNRNLLSTYTSAFGLCFSNPIIIFILMTLFARFDYFATDNIFIVFISLVSILAGAFLWWCFLTFTVGIFRSKFKTRGLRMLNLVAGSVLMVLAVAGVVTGISDMITKYLK